MTATTEGCWREGKPQSGQPLNISSSDGDKGVEINPTYIAKLHHKLRFN